MGGCQIYAGYAAQNFQQQRFLSEAIKTKMMTGASAGGISSTATIGMIHLLVVPIGLTTVAGVIGGATASGALAAFEGGANDSGTSFGALGGIIIAGIAGYIEKCRAEPWRK